MNDIIFTGLVMAGAYGIMKLVRKIRAKARSRIEEHRGVAEPRDLGALTRAADGTYVPEQGRPPG